MCHASDTTVTMFNDKHNMSLYRPDICRLDAGMRVEELHSQGLSE
jgi:hypothetical protein